MIKYYTRACNFNYGTLSKRLIKSIKSLEDFSNSKFNDYLIGLANESINRSKWVLINE